MQDSLLDTIRGKVTWRLRDLHGNVTHEETKSNIWTAYGREFLVRKIARGLLTPGVNQWDNGHISGLDVTDDICYVAVGNGAHAVSPSVLALASPLRAVTAIGAPFMYPAIGPDAKPTYYLLPIAAEPLFTATLPNVMVTFVFEFGLNTFEGNDVEITEAGLFLRSAADADDATALTATPVAYTTRTIPKSTDAYLEIEWEVQA